MPGHPIPKRQIANKPHLTVYRYSDELQHCLHSKIKAEPWLHIYLGPRNEGKGRNFVYYCIFVWDTRQVLDSGKVPLEQCRSMITVSRGEGAMRPKAAIAVDNNELLKGSGDIVDAINEALQYHAKGIHASPWHRYDKQSNK